MNACLDQHSHLLRVYYRRTLAISEGAYYTGGIMHTCVCRDKSGRRSREHVQVPTAGGWVEKTASSVNCPWLF